MANFTDSFTPYDIPLFTQGMRLPSVIIKDEEKGKLELPPSASNFDYLKQLAWNGCLDKIKKGIIKQDKNLCIERLKEEFRVFQLTGVTDYLLFVRDILLWCDDNKVVRGVGRGSCSGSFGCYCLDIILINPLNHPQMVFSRFLSEARAKPVNRGDYFTFDGKAFCDLDVDVSQKHRSRVLAEIERRYPGKTCKILTMQELTGKMAMKDTLKSYLEYNEDESMDVTDNFEAVFGKMDSIEKTEVKSKSFATWRDKSEENKEAVKIAKKLEGLYRTKNGGVHASGILCSFYPLKDILPMELSSDGEVVSGYTMDTCLTFSIKFDLLGLQTTDQLQACEVLTGIKYREIDVNQPSIYGFLSESSLFYGLFQISDGVTKQLTTRAKPKNIEQLAACLAIGRPGAIQHSEEFIKFLETGEKQTVHPQMDEILKDTGGIIIYQESINRICQEVYGMSAIDADEVRRIIGKKLDKEIKKWEPVIRQKGIEKGIPEKVTDWFWQTCNASAEYLFSANHCLAYSYITAMTVYYKANFPKEYYLACLRLSQNKSDTITEISEIKLEMNKLNYSLLPPDILKSEEDFTIEGDAIRTGLSSIKGLADKSLESVKNFKATTTSKFDLLSNLENGKIPINVASSLILSGCFDSILCGATRNKLLLEYEIWKELTTREKPIVVSLGASNNYNLPDIVKAMAETLKNEKGKPYISETRIATLRRDCAPYFEKFKRNSRNEDLTNWITETHFIGFSHSTTLKKIYEVDMPYLVDIGETKKDLDKNKFIIACRVKEVKKRISRQKKVAYLSLILSDETGEVKSMIWGEESQKTTNSLNGRELEEGDIIVAHLSRKDGKSDLYYANSVILQDMPVVIKKSELKGKK